MLSKFVLITVLLVLGTGPLQLEGQDSSKLSDAVSKVSRSIVRIDVTFRFKIQETGDTMEWYSTGTGFIVDKTGAVATANHVVSEQITYKNISDQLSVSGKHIVKDSLVMSNLEITQVMSNDHLYYDITLGEHASVRLLDPQNDIAILRSAHNLTISPAVRIKLGNRRSEPLRVPDFYPGSPREGDRIATTGFPGLSGFKRGVPGLTTNAGTIANAMFMQGDNDRYLADMRVNHGDSGGPVYESDTGRILGFTDAYLPTQTGENSGLAVIVPISYVLHLVGQTSK